MKECFIFANIVYKTRWSTTFNWSTQTMKQCRHIKRWLELRCYRIRKENRKKKQTERSMVPVRWRAVCPCGALMLTFAPFSRSIRRQSTGLQVVEWGNEFCMNKWVVISVKMNYTVSTSLTFESSSKTGRHTTAAERKQRCQIVCNHINCFWICCKHQLQRKIFSLICSHVQWSSWIHSLATSFTIQKLE